MATERNVVDFKIHNLTEEQFQELKEAGQIDPNAIYCTPDETVANFEAVNARIDETNKKLNTFESGVNETVGVINTTITNVDKKVDEAIQTEQQHNIEINARVDETVANFEELSERIDTANERIDTKQDIATAINYGHVTNCITEIPQDIKLELNNGILTLKAGSKVYVPNGFETDGTTPKFDIVTIENDIQRLSADNNTLFLSLNTTDNTITATTINKAISGSSISPIAYGLVYDTSTNKITKYDASIQPLYNTSFPFAIITSNTTQIVSINQVFNGFGYTGSTVFALPGVKGLIPNGRNADGSLNNIQFVVEKPLYQNTSTTNLDVWSILRIEYGEIALASTATNTGGYNPNTNYNVFNGRNSISCIVTREYFDSNGKITTFTPKTVFHAVDYNDFMNAIPAGIVAPFAGTTPPAGWLKCDGSAVSRTTYAALFAAIGTKYGSGNGSTTFNLPTQSVLPLGTSASVSLTANGTLQIKNSSGGLENVVKSATGDNSGRRQLVVNADGNGQNAVVQYGGGIAGTVNIANATGAKAIVCIKY